MHFTPFSVRYAKTTLLTASPQSCPLFFLTTETWLYKHLIALGSRENVMTPRSVGITLREATTSHRVQAFGPSILCKLVASLDFPLVGKVTV